MLNRERSTTYVLIIIPTAFSLTIKIGLKMLERGINSLILVNL